ncbi:MAG TPA: DUF3501 family protein [Gammaproteobacteria bacterium]|nr:DUF3501 family protein [Gammaproteobacteria bacterium]
MSSSHTLRPSDLLSLEDYHRQRTEFRERVLAHKRNRQVALGPNATLYFEDRLTMQYQVQEMLRVERIFETAAIEEELAAYNPMIPDGSNLKATFMLEYAEVEERRVALQRLRGIEGTVYMQVAGRARVPAIADEDLERTDAQKTSAVHFLRFEFAPQDVSALHGGSALAAGVDHTNYSYEIDLSDNIRAALIADFD